MEITVPCSSDYLALAEINNRAIQPFFEIYSQEEIDTFGQSLLENEKSISEAVKTHHVLCTRIASQVAGFIIFKEKYENTVWVSSLYVDPAHQRRSVGKMLIRSAEDFAMKKNLRVVALETHSKATWAKRFYESVNYKILSESRADNPSETIGLEFHKHRLTYYKLIKAVCCN